MNRVASLQVSLLVSLGLVSLACGGTTSGHVDEDGNGATGAGGNAGGGPPTGSSGTRTIGGQATAVAGAGSSGGRGIPQCTSPKTDPETGLVGCAEGYSHRPAPVECSVVGGAPAQAGPGNTAEPGLPRAALGATPCTGAAGDCKQFELGFCDRSYGPAVCNSGCIQDTDCPPGNICICSGPSDHGGECHLSNCASDADCGQGSRCASTDAPCGPSGFSCQAAADECVTAQDCNSALCIFDQEKSTRACLSVTCGRPFLVEANARVAAVVTSRAWSADDVAPASVVHLSERERARLAEQWTHMGQMEHASIAAFARFSLQLLALGAPPELIEGCTQALADETAHTKLCFAFASTYAGRPLGPGPLDIAHSLDVSALCDVVDLVIAEGCFGETSAALQALEAADSAEDPAVVAAYGLIASDEQRHAELAFRFVRWALEQDREGVAARVELALEQQTPGADPAARAVARPCLQALLKSARSPVPSSRAA